MKFEGSLAIAAPRDAVWAFLTDPNRVGGCGPGVEEIKIVDETHFDAMARVGVGFITARFAVNLEILEVRAPEHAVISARGRASGSAGEATAALTLRDEGPTTTMDWQADVVISGTLASVGSHLIESTAHKLITQSFDCIRTKLEAET